MNLKQFDEAMSDLDARLKKLKALYEQYFQGIERIEPAKQREDLDRLFRFMHRERPRNTAARFKFQTLNARFKTYQTYWNRIGRRIEEGTFQRDVKRAKRRKERQERQQEAHTFEIDIDMATDFDFSNFEEFERADKTDPNIDLNQLQATAQAVPPRPVATFAPPTERTPRRPAPPPGVSAVIPQTQGIAKPPPPPGQPPSIPTPPARPPVPPARRAQSPVRPPPPSAQSPRPPGQVPAVAQRSFGKPTSQSVPKPQKSGPMGEAEIKQIYSQYVSARRDNNERTDNLNYEKVAKSIRKMMPKLREKHGNRKIDFEVVLQNGRVGLKPKIK